MGSVNYLVTKMQRMNFQPNILLPNNADTLKWMKISQLMGVHEFLNLYITAYILNVPRASSSIVHTEFVVESIAMSSDILIFCKTYPAEFKKALSTYIILDSQIIYEHQESTNTSYDHILRSFQWVRCILPSGTSLSS
jgi:hypothetical protein